MPHGSSCVSAWRKSNLPRSSARATPAVSCRYLPTRPNQLWGTDSTDAFTEKDGQVAVFAALYHCTADCLGIHAVKKAHRFEALEPTR